MTCPPDLQHPEAVPALLQLRLVTKQFPGMLADQERIRIDIYLKDNLP